MHIAMRAGNVINFKFYASRKSKPPIENDAVPNLWYAFKKKNVIINM